MNQDWWASGYPHIKVSSDMSPHGGGLFRFSNINHNSQIGRSSVGILIPTPQPTLLFSGIHSHASSTVVNYQTSSEGHSHTDMPLKVHITKQFLKNSGNIKFLKSKFLVLIINTKNVRGVFLKSLEALRDWASKCNRSLSLSPHTSFSQLTWIRHRLVFSLLLMNLNNLWCFVEALHLSLSVSETTFFKKRFQWVGKYNIIPSRKW